MKNVSVSKPLLDDSPSRHSEAFTTRGGSEAHQQVFCQKITASESRATVLQPPSQARGLG